MITKKTSNALRLGDASTAANDRVATVVHIVGRSRQLEARLERTRETAEYRTAYFRETFSDELWQAMEHRGLNQAQFAEKAGVAKQFLTKVFRGGNCTMDTIVKLAFSLNYTANIHLTPNEVSCAWLHRIPDFLSKPGTSGAALWIEGKYDKVNSLEKEVQLAAVPSNS